MALFALPAIAASAGALGTSTGFQLASIALPAAKAGLTAYGLSSVLNGQGQGQQVVGAPAPQQAPQEPLPTGLAQTFSPQNRFRSLRFS